MAHPARPIPIVGTQNAARIAEIADAFKPSAGRAPNGTRCWSPRAGRNCHDACRPCEVSWFSALCDDDYEFLGVPDPMLKSSWEHCRDIVLQAETGGFDNILLPSGYAARHRHHRLRRGDRADAASACALLMAVRIGESWPPQLARQIATLDRHARAGG